VNPRQKLFCEYYCGECYGNPVQAALKAGYSPSYARANAVDKVLKNTAVQKYITELNNKSSSVCSKKIATIADVKAFWTDVMNDENEIMKNRIRASELIAKAAGAFNNDW
jgi:phage terminase small subunit